MIHLLTIQKNILKCAKTRNIARTKKLTMIYMHVKVGPTLPHYYNNMARKSLIQFSLRVSVADIV